MVTNKNNPPKQKQKQKAERGTLFNVAALGEKAELRDTLLVCPWDPKVKLKFTEKARQRCTHVSSPNKRLAQTITNLLFSKLPFLQKGYLARF